MKFLIILYLIKYQPGFRANFSTDSCLAQLTDVILTGMDKGIRTGLDLIDLQKAFGTLDHKILLNHKMFLSKFQNIN